MIKHLVFFKLHPEHAARAPELVAKLNALVGVVPSLIHLQAGQDVLHGAASWDVGLVSDFKNLEDLEAYRVHPAHQKVVELVQQVCAQRAVVDFEYN